MSGVRPPSTIFEWIDRIGRPVFIRILLPIALVWLCWEIVSIFLEGARQSVRTGQPMPDLTGGLSPIILAIISLVGPIIMDQWTRGRQREAEIARGSAPGPFGQPSPPPAAAPSETSVTGGLVNNEAIR